MLHTLYADTKEPYSPTLLKMLVELTVDPYCPTGLKTDAASTALQDRHPKKVPCPGPPNSRRSDPEAPTRPAMSAELGAVVAAT
jgi:hypothetical protein